MQLTKSHVLEDFSISCAMIVKLMCGAYLSMSAAYTVSVNGYSVCHFSTCGDRVGEVVLVFTFHQCHANEICLQFQHLTSEIRIFGLSTLL